VGKGQEKGAAKKTRRVLKNELGVQMKDIHKWASGKFGIGFWTGALVYSLINMIMNLSSIAQSKVLNYNYIISGAAVVGLIFNIILMKKAKQKKQ
jgi:hypothetical protein